ncbi:MAG: hypothetical protein ACRDPT_10490 [Streptomycetales bacterium]
MRRRCRAQAASRPSRLSSGSGGGHLVFGYTTYFDMVDVCEAVAHELAACSLPLSSSARAGALDWGQLPFRALVRDPFDLSRRPLLPSINTLTIRRGPSGASFMLHQRDAASVAVAGGVYHVMPAGVFQPSSIAPWDQANDFDLWRNVMREFSEEFLGNPEHDGTGGVPIDYDSEPFRSLTAARNQGRLRTHCFGIGLDPLTLAGEILTVAVIDADAFDDVFEELVTANSEGLLVATNPDRLTEGVPFTGENVSRLLTSGSLAPSAAACLALTWQHRDRLLG